MSSDIAKRCRDCKVIVYVNIETSTRTKCGCEPKVCDESSDACIPPSFPRGEGDIIVYPHPPQMPGSFLNQIYLDTGSGCFYYWNCYTWILIPCCCSDIPGLQGEPGPQGNPGVAGPQGNPGVAGSQGVPGAQGNPGVDGVQGNSGVAGAQGNPGAQGSPGLVGAQGDPGVAGAQGNPGAQGVPGAQGTPGLNLLNVENTAFVDSIFGSNITGVVQDEALPFATIVAALAAVALARILPTDRWEIIVRPGIFNENLINLTIPNANTYIRGSGDSTIINGTFDQIEGAGPFGISGVYVNLLSAHGVPANVVVRDTMVIEDSKWFHTPTSSIIGEAFNITGAANPSLTMTESFISVLPPNPAAVSTGFFMIRDMAGVTTQVILNHVTGVQAGLAAGVIGFDTISGLISFVSKDCYWDLTVHDTLNPNIIDFVYGGFGSLGVGNGIFDLQWMIANTGHTIRNATGVINISPQIIAVLTGFAFTQQPDSYFIFRDSIFRYENYPPGSPIYSATDMISLGNFIQMLDNKWLGVTLSAPTPTEYVPYQKTTAPFPSVPIVYEAISARGSVLSSGGLQVGTSVLPADTTVHTVSDHDMIISWSASGILAALALSLPATGVPEGPVYIGKIVVVFNANTLPGNIITVAALLPAVTAGNFVALVGPGQTQVYATYDGATWISVAGNL